MLFLGAQPGFLSSHASRLPPAPTCALCLWTWLWSYVLRGSVGFLNPQVVGQRPSEGQEAGLCLSLGLQLGPLSQEDGAVGGLAEHLAGALEGGVPETPPPAAPAGGSFRWIRRTPWGTTQPALCPPHCRVC